MKNMLLPSFILLCVFNYCDYSEGAMGKDPNTAVKKWRAPACWSADINAFKQLDDANTPPQKAILFVGSSSIRMWDIQKSFPLLVTINRGFGGSYISESVYYVDKIVIPYHPSVIVFYAGDNDITDDKTPCQVAADFNNFVVLVHKSLPDTRIIYISIKPSIQRWNLWPKMKETNERIRTSAKAAKNVEFLDVSQQMLGEDGKPKPSYFQKDGLHLSEEGYRLWSSLLGPLIEKYGYQK